MRRRFAGLGAWCHRRCCRWDTVGTSVGVADGTTEGSSDSTCDGDSLGLALGATDGAADGTQWAPRWAWLTEQPRGALTAHATEIRWAWRLVPPTVLQMGHSGHLGGRG